MTMRTFAGLVCVLALASCDRPAKQSEAPSAPAQSGGTLAETMPRTISATEAANFQVALAQLPQGATLSHAVAEGPAVALHYTATTAQGPSAGAQFIVVDSNQAITENNRIELPSNPDPHLTGATSAAPDSTDGGAENVNKRAVLAFFQALTSGNVDAAARQVGDDVIEHTGTGAQGRAAWTTAIRAEPARQYGIQRIAAWNDIVMTYQSVGTVGDGGAVRWAPGWDIFRLRDGRIVERWRVNY